ncbi:MAG: cysteine desulfurase [Bacteroidales bacterium]|jgi:cysteine desulfurase/selenocysteine lyase|nr:cysteine desulfurase [Bacteroidales bacterium]
MKKNFPFFEYNKDLVYFDSAATTQKPDCVIRRIGDYYSQINSNVHRSVHSLGIKTTETMENTREKVQKFINASDKSGIIFTKGSTESINLVASSFAQMSINEGDSVVVTIMEHHSNFVIWQQICKQKKAHLKVLSLNGNFELDLQKLEEFLTPDVKILALTHISNVLGTVNPMKDVVKLAHSKNIPVLIDGAQAMAHLQVDVQDLDCDFYVFSGHKMYAPMGIGVLYGKKAMLEALPPYQFGGEMIESVSIENTTFNDLPYKFEAGTPNVEGILGLETAIDFTNEIGFEKIIRHEKELMDYAMEKLLALNFLDVYACQQGVLPSKAVISFNLKNQHPSDVGTLLNGFNIAVRTGHHCAEPLMNFLGIPGTVRISFGLYNNIEDINKFIFALQKIAVMLQ